MSTNLTAVYERGTTILMVGFLVLWQVAEHKERTALQVAASTVEAHRGCVVSYATSAARMNAAVDALTMQLQAGQ